MAYFGRRKGDKMKKITLQKNGTFEHLWISAIHTIPAAAIDVSNADFMLLSQNTGTKRYDIATGTVLDYVPDFVFTDAVNSKQSDINAAFNAALNSITQLYTRQEIDSWPTQEAEATAWTNDNAEPTPLIDAMVANRPGIDKAELVGRIISNVIDYKGTSGAAIGKKQAFEDELYALPTAAIQADFDLIVVVF